MGVYARCACLVTAGAAAVALSSLAAPVAASAATTSQARTTVFSSKLWKLDAIAMDGSKLAIAREARLQVFPPGVRRPTFALCHEVDVTGVISPRLVRVSLRSRGDYCGNGGFGQSEASSFLTLGGSHAYWVYAQLGNTEVAQTLFTGAPGTTQRVLFRPVPGQRPTGPFLGPIAASGPTLAYSQWRRVYLPLGCDPFAGGQCTLSAPRDMTLTLDGHRISVPAPGGVVASVDKGRAAVMLGDGRVAVVSRHAAPVITTPISRVTGRVDDAALAGRWLVLLVNQRMCVFDAATGRARAACWPAQGATHVDVWNGIAVVATHRQIVAVRLSNGHRHVIQQLGAGRKFVGGAQIEAGGIVWATQPVHDTGTGLNAIFRVPVPLLH